MKMRSYMAATCILLAAVSVRADEMNTLIDEGEKAYAARDYQKAVDIFQQVVQRLQLRIGEAIERFFPDAHKGWTAGAVENTNWSGSSGEQSHSFVNSTRVYTRKADGVEITVQFCNWPMIMQGAKAGMAAYSNPMMAQMLKLQGIEFKSDEKAGWIVMSIVDSKSDSTQINAFSDRAMILVQTQASAADAASNYFGEIDLEGLDTALQ
ncbi:MAG: hypothetical protein HKP10_07910 [Kiritimatiellales bacterium]|nr:hypothetical protein [Pontiella sp.]NNJ71194.1 hypothetical protein [Kiritimatiellales bacterium]